MVYCFTLRYLAYIVYLYFTCSLLVCRNIEGILKTTTNHCKLVPSVLLKESGMSLGDHHNYEHVNKH